MVERNDQRIRFFTFESIDAHPRVSAVVTTRHGGMSTGPFASLNLGRRGGDAAAAVEANRKRAASLVGARIEDLVFGRQVHGATVAEVSRDDRGRVFEDTDALVTSEPDTPLAILTADCAAVFVYDPVRQVVAVAHAGWRGTVARIAAGVVARMQAAFGSHLDELVAAIGPSIGPCCYEVGREVIEAVGDAFPDAVDELLQEPDMASAGSFRTAVNEERKYFDLWRANERVLLDAGVNGERIEVARLCTACRTDLFYSHRAEKGNTGRFAALVTLHGHSARRY